VEQFHPKTSRLRRKVNSPSAPSAEVQATVVISSRSSQPIEKIERAAKIENYMRPVLIGIQQAVGAVVRSYTLPSALDTSRPPTARQSGCKVNLAKLDRTLIRLVRY
jgi:hypothetical protein